MNIFNHAHPSQMEPADLAKLSQQQYDELRDLTKLHMQTTGCSFKEAAARAAATSSKRFSEMVPELKQHGKDWHIWHMDIIDQYAKDHGLMKEDVPTNSMAGGAIANKPMGLGGIRTHLVKREILRVLGKVRARNRTKVRY